jgi:F0F1-type ATP synthase assembly protein I
VKLRDAVDGLWISIYAVFVAGVLVGIVLGRV